MKTVDAALCRRGGNRASIFGRGLFVRMAVVCASAASITSAGRAATVVYGDSLTAGWQNWSWSSTVNFAATSPTHAGSAASLSVRYDAGWAGLYLHTAGALSTSDLVSLRFSIHGGTTGGQRIRVTAYDAGGNAGAGLALSPLTAGTWTDVEVPISIFAISSVGGLVWQDQSGAAASTFYLDDIALVTGTSPPGGGPALSIDAASDVHPISPYIYGINYADAALAADLRLPVRRWGGNATTRYNYLLDTSNRGSDWYFENIPESVANPAALPNGSSADRFVEQDRSAGTATLMTVPLIGWTPKSRAYTGGFAVSRYGAQLSVDPYRPDFGNGVRTDGSNITGNDPADTSIAIGPAFVQGWISHFVGRYGTAAGGGVRFYNLDNEPALWNYTHRDVHPAPLSYDELRDRTWQYAAAIKAADPGAQTLGPAEYGWSGYFYSALDMAAGGAWWNTRPDRRAHGDVELIAWYLQQMRAYEQSNGVRILDYLDLHCYPQGGGVALSAAGDAATQALRLRSTRSLWDPTYVDESWINDTMRLIPRMRDWVAANYPGTKLAFTEYNWGGVEHINGALAQADVLGIFGRERLDLATMWDPPGFSQPAAFAFRMYRNYDGAGRGFGETSVRAVSANSSAVSIFAARRADAALTAMLINKATDARTCNFAVQNFAVGGPVQVYRYSDASLSQIVRGADFTLVGGAASITLPAASITLLVIPAQSPALRGDMNCDGAVNNFDIDPFVLALTNPAAWQATYPGCSTQNGDTNRDGQFNNFDIDPFVQCVVSGGCP